MSRYSITVSGAELDVVTLALGRMLDAKPIVDTQPKTTRTPRVKPPTLPRGGFVKLADRWAEAVTDPTKWHYPLQYRAAEATNHQASDIRRAWGIV